MTSQRTADVIPLNGQAPSAPPGERPRFKPPILGRELVKETAVAKGGEALYVYRDGAYRPGGEEDIQRRVAHAVGDGWKKAMGDEVVAWCRATAPTLEQAPPRDRVNCATGILNLDTGDLGPHSPDFLSPVQIAAAYDPTATCPAIDKFLADVLPEECAVLIYELAGYLVTPDNTLQKAFMLTGPGGSGKSTMLGVLRALLGRENVSAVPLHTLEEDRFATADLYGRMANVFADLDARALRASSIFKSVTGGDAIRGERKHRPPFTWTPYARLLFSANEAPPTADSSDAFFDRWVILPFARRFRDTGAQDPHLLDKLTTPAELSGLLNRALAALPALHARRGFTTTDATREAGDRFRVDSDTVAGFLAECCDVAPVVRSARPTLFKAYREWCEENNRGALGAQRFASRIRQLVPGLDEVFLHGVVQLIGLKLREEATW